MHRLASSGAPERRALARSGFKDAALYGARVALEYRPNLHFLGSFAWSPGRDRFAVSDHKVNVYQYDVGWSTT